MYAPQYTIMVDSHLIELARMWYYKVEFMRLFSKQLDG